MFEVSVSRRKMSTHDPLGRVSRRKIAMNTPERWSHECRMLASKFKFWRQCSFFLMRTTTQPLHGLMHTTIYYSRSPSKSIIMTTPFEKKSDDLDINRPRFNF
jgi:hypothetical protein